YIRGFALTTPNLATAGVAGLAPNVALYLDEQPLSQPGRNLDVCAADRLEDDYSNTRWTVEGRLAMLDIVCAGAYIGRETEQRVDYTDYLFVGQYLPYTSALDRSLIRAMMARTALARRPICS
ncbi:MAG: hypothetical protein WA948_08190, partial [Pontixanthobacter sp.]